MHITTGRKPVDDRYFSFVRIIICHRRGSVRERRSHETVASRAVLFDGKRHTTILGAIDECGGAAGVVELADKLGDSVLAITPIMTRLTAAKLVHAVPGMNGTEDVRYLLTNQGRTRLSTIRRTA